MSNILTAAEASVVLRCDVDDEMMLDLLPQVNTYLEMATGRDWTADSPIYAEAKSAARMLLVRWHEDPGGMASGASMGFGLTAALTQLEAKALKLAVDGVPDEGLEIEATNISGYMAVDASIVLVFNHEMSTGSVNAVTLTTSGGSAVATANALNATGKIMTVNPTGSLAAASGYTVVITDAADIYGQTIETTVSFTTA